MSEQEDVCCEPTGEMVGALRHVFEIGGRPVGPGIARAALTAALMVHHEQREQELKQLSEQSSTHKPDMSKADKFWLRGGEGDYVMICRRDDDDLTIEIEDGSDYAYVVLPQAAESLLEWLDRSRS